MNPSNVDPNEMHYEISSFEQSGEDGGDDEEYVPGGDDDAEEEEEGGNEEGVGDTEEEGLSDEEDGGEVRFRLVHEDEEVDEDDGGPPIRHYLTIPGGMPFRVEILGLSGRRRDPRRNLVRGAEPVPSPEGQELMKSGEFGAVSAPTTTTL